MTSLFTNPQSASPVALDGCSRVTAPRADESAVVHSNLSAPPILPDMQTDTAGEVVPSASPAPLNGRPWTDVEKAQVAEYISAGLSGSQIAAKFEGRTRNAVIGLCHRIGLKLKNPIGWTEGNKRGRHKAKTVKPISIAAQRRKNVRGGKQRKVNPVSASNGRPEGSKRLQVLREPNYAAEPDVGISTRRDAEAGAALPAPAPIPRKSMHELESGDCKWIVEGAGADAQFCAGPRLAGYSWCLDHCRRGFLNFECRSEAA